MTPEAHDTTTWAGWAAFALTFVTAVWRGYFGAKSIRREDHKGQVIHGTYEELVEDLRDEVRRLREELEREYRLRMESEARVEQLMKKVSSLEERCARIPVPRPKD